MISPFIKSEYLFEIMKFVLCIVLRRLCVKLRDNKKEIYREGICSIVLVFVCVCA